MTRNLQDGTSCTRRIIKANNFAAEQGTLKRYLLGPDARIEEDDTRLTVADSLLGILGASELDTYAKDDVKKRDDGGIYSLNTMLHHKIESGNAGDLKVMLEEGLKSDVPREDDFEKRVMKRVAEAYKLILDEADVVVATPVVASQMADKGYFDPTVVIFDDAGMMTESDFILVMQQFPRTRCFIYAGDHYQGGIISPTKDNRALSREVNSLNANEAPTPEEYLAKTKMLNYVNPFAPQFTTSMLSRVDRASGGYASQLMHNYRQQAGLEYVAGRIAYEGKMRAAHPSLHMVPLVQDFRNFLEDLRDELAAQKVRVVGDDNKARMKSGKKQGPLESNRLTVLMDGNPDRPTNSWSNTEQCRFALHVATRLHQSAVKLPLSSGDDNPTGLRHELPSIFIMTPYSMAAHELRRMLRALSDAEICKAKVSVKTIDDAQGDEADFAITVYAIGEAGGFLWQKPRVVVALTRPRLGAVDIIADGLCEKRGERWSHFRTMKSAQGTFRALVEERRSWADIDQATRLPATSDVGGTKAWCFNCGRHGHHTRNCAAPSEAMSAIWEETKRPRV